jgi:hypothetical protein
MTALVRYGEAVDTAPTRSWVELMAPAAELARAIAPTEFVPRSYRNNPPAITACILYGDELGLAPMQSLEGIVMVEGRPTLYAKTQRALVQAAGHAIWPDEMTASRSTWCGRRRGADEVTRVTWTMDDARRANLAGKPNYRNYPRQMLSARASAELVGAVFADVVGGLRAIEELDDEATALEVVADTGPRAAGQTRQAGTRRRRRPAAAAALPAPDIDTRGDRPEAEVLPPLPGEGDEGDAARGDAFAADPPSAASASDLASRGQIGRIMGKFRDRGMGGTGALERGRRLAYCQAVVGRPLTTSKELTADEADRVLDHLDADRSADDDAPVDDPPAGDEANA